MQPPAKIEGEGREGMVLILAWGDRELYKGDGARAFLRWNRSIHT